MADWELYNFLQGLRVELMQVGLTDAVKKIDWAMAFSVNTGSEFLGESRIALTAIRDSHRRSLSSDQLSRINEVIEKINAAFRRVGG